MVAVWAGCALEEAGGRAQGEVSVDAEVEHQGDEAVGAEDGVAGAEPVVVGHCDPAGGWESAFVCGTSIALNCEDGIVSRT